MQNLRAKQSALWRIGKQRINQALEQFQMGWNFHSLNTESNLSPYQMWISGAIADRFSTFTGVQDILDSEVDNFMVSIHAIWDAFLKTTLLKYQFQRSAFL